MNKRQIIASLNKIANELDSALLFVEANTITKVMTKLAQNIDDTDGDWRDSLLTPQQKADVSRGTHLEGIFKIFEKYFNKMFGHHSGFSGSFVIMMGKNYLKNNAADQRQIKELYEWKTRNHQPGLDMERDMDAEVLKMINFLHDFQKEHGLPNEVMTDFVGALK
jgi:hypothetical protein